MNKRHCEDCDVMLDKVNTPTSFISPSNKDRAINARIEHWHSGWTLNDDYCRACLGNLMFEYSQWLLRKL
jgi:hypothetical protein